MTKTQLINNLKSKFFWVEENDTNWKKLPLVFNGYELFSIPVLEKKDEAMWENNVLIWEKNAGYLWKNGEPKSLESQFGADLEAFIREKVTDDTIKEGTIERFDGAVKKAIVKIIIDEAGTLKEKRFLVFKDAQNKFQYQLIA